MECWNYRRSTTWRGAALAVLCGEAMSQEARSAEKNLAWAESARPRYSAKKAASAESAQEVDDPALKRHGSRFQPPQHSNTPTPHHSITPTLQHSNTPTLQHSNTPTLQHSNTPTLQHPNTPILQYSVGFVALLPSCCRKKRSQLSHQPLGFLFWDIVATGEHKAESIRCDRQ